MVALSHKFLRIVRKKSTTTEAAPSNGADKSELNGHAPGSTALGYKLMKWEAQCDISAPNAKKFSTIKDGDRILDYQDVTLEGYLATFSNMDRDGEFVEPGAFKETIQEFMRNPVLLLNHRNAVESTVGSFTELAEDTKGLKFRATISNANTDAVRHVRALVAEGHLKTTSMGGVFHFRPDGRAIFKVDLFEGSLTPIPANPKALFSVRALTEAEMKTVRIETAS